MTSTCGRNSDARVSAHVSDAVSKSDHADVGTASVLVARGLGGLLNIHPVSGPIGFVPRGERGLGSEPSAPSVCSRMMSACPKNLFGSVTTRTMTLNSLTFGRGHHGTYPGASIGNVSMVAFACSHARW